MRNRTRSQLLANGPLLIHDLSPGLLLDKHDGAISGAETAYPSGAHEFSLGF
jgi:hypothetical protein